MKKFTKIMARVLPIVLVGLLVVSNVFGIGTDFTTIESAGSAEGSTTVKNVTTSVWSTVALVVRILAVAAVVFAGLRYMFASADTKADIKQQMIILVLGAVLVFGATFILGAINTITGDVKTGAGL